MLAQTVQSAVRCARRPQHPAQPTTRQSVRSVTEAGPFRRPTEPVQVSRYLLHMLCFNRSLNGR